MKRDKITPNGDNNTEQTARSYEALAAIAGTLLGSLVPGDDEKPPMVPDNYSPGIVPDDSAKDPTVVPDDVPKGTHADTTDPKDDNRPPREQLQSTCETFTPEMREWLTSNCKDYELYMMHMAFHDQLWRLKMIGTPVTPDDFRRESYALVMGALIGATKVLGVLNHELPTPPSREFMRTYIEVVAREFGSDDEEITEALNLVSRLQDEKYKEMHYCVGPYFEGWYGSIRSKRAAKELMKVDVPDVPGAIEDIENALANAREAARGEEGDAYLDFFSGTAIERQPRSSTGIDGLDECLNGGWGQGECYLIFGGSGGGKSIAAGQCAWHEASANDGRPLIVSTELFPREFIARIISCGCSIPIHLLQDCENPCQIRQAIATDWSQLHKLPEVEEALKLLQDRAYIYKVSADDGMDARAVLNRAVLRYEKVYGRRPTWVCLDWLGSVADVGAGSGRGGASERAMVWEHAANGCVKFAEFSGIPTLVLAQAVNDAQTRPVLTINEIGISKGIGKNMTAVFGLGNSIDQSAKKGQATDKSRPMFRKDQFLCVCKSRKGEARNIPVRRDFLYQRFVAAQEEVPLDSVDEAPGNASTDKQVGDSEELAKAFGEDDLLPRADLRERIARIRNIIPASAEQRIKKYMKLGLFEKVAGNRYRRVTPESAA